MRILYLSQSYVPSRRADSVQVVKMCAAFARAGHDVELVTKGCPERQESEVQDDFAFYGVGSSFRITKLRRPAFKGGGLFYAAAMAAHLRRRRREVDLVFSRDLLGAWLASRMRLPLRFEAHGVPRGALARHLFRSFSTAPGFQGLVVITRALLAELQRQRLYAGDRFIVTPDAADPRPVDGTEAGRQVAIAVQPERFNVGYVGHLYPGRGIELIAALAERLPDCDFHIVGGHDESVESWRRDSAATNLLFHGFLPPSELEGVYPVFDALLMPYQRKVGVQSGRSDTSGWMSPMKLFEYMAAGKAILSSDLPVLREVLEDGRNALLLPPDDADAWEQALRKLVSDSTLGHRLGQAAASDLLHKYTWDARVGRVLDER